MKRILPASALFDWCRAAASSASGDVIPQLVTVPPGTFIMNLVIFLLGGLSKRILFNDNEYLQRVRN